MSFVSDLKERMRPTWFNPKGEGMRQIGRPAKEGVVFRNEEQATLQIKPDKDTPGGFIIVATLRHPGYESCVRFSVETADHLHDMFGIGDSTNKEKVRRMFVRKGPYLNIPHKGSGRDDDLNFSIFVTPLIKSAIELVIGRSQ